MKKLFFILFIFFSLLLNANTVKQAKVYFENGATFSALNTLNAINTKTLTATEKVEYLRLYYYLNYNMGNLQEARMYAKQLWLFENPKQTENSIYTAQYYAYLASTYNYDIRVDSGLYYSEKAVQIFNAYSLKEKLLIDAYHIHKCRASVFRNANSPEMNALNRAGKTEELKKLRKQTITALFDTAMYYCKLQYPKTNYHTTILMRSKANYFIDLIASAASTHNTKELKILIPEINKMYKGSNAIIKQLYSAKHPDIALNLLLNSLVYNYTGELNTSISYIEKAKQILSQNIEGTTIVANPYLMLTYNTYKSYIYNKLFLQDKKIDDLNVVISSNKEVAPLYLDYLTIIKKSSKKLNDAYNINPYYMLIGNYYFAYSKTKNKQYCDSFFDASEKCKQLYTLINSQLNNSANDIIAKYANYEQVIYFNKTLQQYPTLSIQTQQLQQVQQKLFTNDAVFYYNHSPLHLSKIGLFGLVFNTTDKNLILLDSSYVTGPIHNANFYNPLFALLKDSSQNARNQFLVSKHKLLIKPLLPYITQTTQHIYLLPDAVNSNLPFDMLCNEKQNYLLESFSLSYLPSFHNFNTQKAIEQKNTITVFSPDFKKYNYTSLPFCQKAATNISDSYNATLVSQNEKQQIGTLFSSSKNILHLFTHSYCNPNFTDSAQIFLGDTILQISTLRQASILNPLVFLASCETDWGWWYKYEGQLSLTKTFLENGAQSVISTAWKADDKACAEISQRFYKYLTQGLNKAEALRQAKLSFIQDFPALNNPLFWAPLKLHGDISSLAIETSLFNNFLNYKSVLIIIGIVIALLILVFKLKRLNS